mgnify:CR=1 FL=1
MKTPPIHLFDELMGSQILESHLILYCLFLHLFHKMLVEQWYSLDAIIELL